LKSALPRRARGEHLLGQVAAAFAAPGVDLRQRDFARRALARVAHRLQFASVSLAKRLIETTGGTPKLRMFSRCRCEVGEAGLHGAATSSRRRDRERDAAVHLERAYRRHDDGGFGLQAAARHLMSKNFSAPRSAPKPASVTTMSPSARPVRGSQ
jgi:hypothetical protein